MADARRQRTTVNSAHTVGQLDPFDVLPDELVHRIFAIALSRRFNGTVRHCPLVSKRWHAFFSRPSKLWETIRLDFGGDAEGSGLSSKTVSRMVWLGRRVQVVKQLHLVLSIRQSSVMARVPSLIGSLLASQLVVLAIDCTDDNVGGALGWDSLEIITNLSSLKMLQLTSICANPGGLEMFGRLSNLTELLLGFLGPGTALAATARSDLPSELSRLSNLRKLMLVGRNPGSHGTLTLPAQLSTLSKLEVLQIRGYALVRLPGSTLPVLPLLPSLTDLEVEIADQFSVPFAASLTAISLNGGGFTESIAKCKDLRVLELQNIDLRTRKAKEAIEMMADSLEHLQRLDLLDRCRFDLVPYQLTTVRVLHLAYWPPNMKRVQTEEVEFWGGLRVLVMPSMNEDRLFLAFRLLSLDVSGMPPTEPLSAVAISFLRRLRDLFLPAQDYNFAAVKALQKILTERQDVAVSFGCADLDGYCDTKDLTLQGVNLSCDHPLIMC